MVEQYCVNCHNTTDWAGQLALDAVEHSHAAIPSEAETWEKVIKRLRGISFEPQRKAPEDVRPFIKSEIEKWGRLSKAAGIEKE